MTASLTLAAPPASLVRLPWNDQPGTHCLVTAVSPDGQTGAGSVDTMDSGLIVRWTEAGPPEVLESHPATATYRLIPTDIAAGGRVIVGAREDYPLFAGWTWTATAGLQDVTPPPGALGSSVTACDNTGRVLVGWASTGTPVACRWVDGVPQVLGQYSPSSPLPTVLLDVSADGTTAIGFATDGGGDSVAVRWTAAEGLQALPTPAGLRSSAEAISADGRTSVGTVWGTEYPESYRVAVWQGLNPPLLLPDLASGATPLFVSSTSGDGSVVVGIAWTGGLFVWDAQHGSRALPDALAEDYGLALGDFVPWDVTGMSDDGQTLVGYGGTIDGPTEGFIIRLPEPAAMVVLAALVAVCRQRKSEPFVAGR